MEASEIELDEDLTMLLTIKQQKREINLQLSDSLEASQEELRLDYKEKIANFINSSGTWYELALKKLFDDLSSDDGVRLIAIFILSEQSDEELVFGLEFKIGSDIEHGRGIKITGKKFSIIEYGVADVAFT